MIKEINFNVNLKMPALTFASIKLYYSESFTRY